MQDGPGAPEDAGGPDRDAGPRPAPARPARLDGLEAVQAEVWRQLARATADRHHAWRTPALATATADGLPALRTVVLREVDAEARRLWIYTDARAAKVAELRREPRAALLAWSPRLHWQVRLSLRVTVHADGPAQAGRWARARQAPSAGDYRAALAPGQPLAGPALPAPAPDAEAHFAALEAEVLALDWLELHPEGHRRAAFDPAGARWLQP